MSYVVVVVANLNRRALGRLPPPPRFSRWVSLYLLRLLPPAGLASWKMRAGISS